MDNIEQDAAHPNRWVPGQSGNPAGRPIDRVHDLLLAHRAVMEAAADGILTADEAKNLAEVLDSHRRAFETGVMEQRIADLERKFGLVEG